MAILDPCYGNLYGHYKQAQGNVFSWLRKQFQKPSNIPVNSYLGLATTAAQDGIKMPDNILDDLRAAIDLRSKVADFHRQSGGSDPGHEYIIGVLEKIRCTFNPGPPKTPVSEPSPYTPIQNDYFTPCAHHPQEYFAPQQPCGVIQPPPELYPPFMDVRAFQPPVEFMDPAIIFTLPVGGIPTDLDEMYDHHSFNNHYWTYHTINDNGATFQVG